MERGRARGEGRRQSAAASPRCVSASELPARPGPVPRTSHVEPAWRAGRKGTPGLQGGGRDVQTPWRLTGRSPESDPDTRFYFKQLKGHQSFTDDKKTKTLSRSCQHPRQKAPNTLVLLSTTATGKGDARGSTDATDCSHTPAAQNPDNRAQLQVNVTQTVLPCKPRETVLPTNHGQALLALRCVAASHPDPACPRVSVALSPSYSGTSWLNTFQREVKLLINTFTLRCVSRHQVSHLRNTWNIKTIQRVLCISDSLEFC